MIDPKKLREEHAAMMVSAKSTTLSTMVIALGRYLASSSGIVCERMGENMGSRGFICMLSSIL